MLGSKLIWAKIDETRFRAANKQGLEIVIVVVSDVRVNVGTARNLGLPHQHPQRFFPISCSWVPTSSPGTGSQVVVQEAQKLMVLMLSLPLLPVLLLLMRLSLLLLLVSLLLLTQMLSSSQLETVVNDARTVASGTQRTPLVSPK